MKKEFFAAMNSYGGFVSHYKSSFAQERRYIIKGGPGCGKSTLMRRIAAEAERRGCSVEYYDCSSDPDSLDGIVLPSLGIAMFDGTAPHEEAASAPGWRDNLIDLGAFWDTELLRTHQDEIIALSEHKSAAYHKAYRYLGMAGTAALLRLELLGECIDTDALSAAAARLTRKAVAGYTCAAKMCEAATDRKTPVKRTTGKKAVCVKTKAANGKAKSGSDKKETENVSISREISALTCDKAVGGSLECASVYSETVKEIHGAAVDDKNVCSSSVCNSSACGGYIGNPQVIVGALGMGGYVYRPTLEQDADEIIALRDCHGAAALLLEEVSRRLCACGIPHTAGLDAPSGDVCVIRAGNVAITLREDIARARGVRMQSCRKLLRTDSRTERAFAELDSAMESFAELAKDRLAEARTAHFELEKIYGETMDYTAADRLCNDLIARLLPPVQKPTPKSAQEHAQRTARKTAPKPVPKTARKKRTEKAAK